MMWWTNLQTCLPPPSECHEVLMRRVLTRFLLKWKIAHNVLEALIQEIDRMLRGVAVNCCCTECALHFKV